MNNKKIDFRTDLADERRNLYKKANKLENEIDGIETQEDVIDEKIKVTKVNVLNEKAEEIIGKKKGKYITIDIKKINLLTEEEKEQSSNVLAKELKELIGEKVQKKEDILVVGLGNSEVTPDALGPNVIKEVEITRHIINYLPQYIDENTRPVSAIAPGVLGTTGIETLEIIKGVVEHIKPKLLIVIDALASRSMERISSTIQISNTGIVPGGGVGNTRKEITEETLGIPVIALGIPTVVETAVVVNDALDIFIEKLQKDAKSNDYLNNLKEEDNYEMIKEALIPKEFNFIVTPKEIDELVLNMSDIVARGINFSMD
ncbi:MAG: GPR endopeptidase [Clostridiaceae bacterium]|nr:GPR endopeptidase [Clostridiaceae bacterium]